MKYNKSQKKYILSHKSKHCPTKWRLKGRKEKSMGMNQKAGHVSNKKNTTFHRISLSPSSVRDQVQTYRTTQAQQKIISFFEPTPKSVSQP